MLVVRLRQVATSAGLAAVLLYSSIQVAWGAGSSIPQPHFPRFDKQVTITWWTWTANADKVIAAFNKVYPNIHVIHPLIGSSSAEYNKLTTTLKAGVGAPDVVQIEYQYLPKFIDTGGLLDISKYVEYAKPYFLDWTWHQASRGQQVYAIPEDIGPLALLYRPDVFKRNGLTPPKTWNQFGEEAVQFHHRHPNQYLTYFPVNDGGLITGLLWQAGAHPFHYTADGWEINIDSPQARKVMNFWGKLIAQGAIQATNDWTPQWESEIGQGVYASVIGAAWSPTYMIEPYVKPSTKNWRASDIPQWNASGPFMDGNWGGSTNAVTVQTKYPQAAALFAAWINSSAAAEVLDVTDIDKEGRGQMPANRYGEQLPKFFAPNPALENQVSAPVFVKAAKSVDTSFEWSPWTDFVYNEMTIEFTKAAKGDETWDQALANIQQHTVVFAKSMGYRVKDMDGTESTGSHSVPPALVVLLVLLAAAALAVIMRRIRTKDVSV
ncbi:MAG: extracellular solute-binding protein [Alicyclobacillus herbarius]|nr:extracellular solute-binding protein [Alicyclobacillus herbarius]